MSYSYYPLTFRTHREGEIPVGTVVIIKTGDERKEACPLFKGWSEFENKEYIVEKYNQFGTMYILNIDGSTPKESLGGGHSKNIFKPVYKTQEIKDMTQSIQFTKADLKTGMRVFLRSGEEYIVIKDLDNSYFGAEKGNTLLMIGDLDQWRDLADYEYNLEYKNYPTSDIVKVLTVNIVTDILKPNPRSTTVIWETPPLETPEEIEHNKLMAQIADLQAQAEKLKPKK